MTHLAGSRLTCELRSASLKTVARWSMRRQGCDDCTASGSRPTQSPTSTRHACVVCQLSSADFQYAMHGHAWPCMPPGSARRSDGVQTLKCALVVAQTDCIWSSAIPVFQCSLEHRSAHTGPSCTASPDIAAGPHRRNEHVFLYARAVQSTSRPLARAHCNMPSLCSLPYVHSCT